MANTETTEGRTGETVEYPAGREIGSEVRQGLDGSGFAQVAY
jgi:hypothetical protein